MKFKLDGEIEGKPESQFLKNQEQIKNKINKKWSFKYNIILALLILGIIILSILYFNSIQTIKLNQKEIIQSEIYKKENIILKESSDSFQKQILKLKHQNELLSENSDSLNGIFFEVQLGNFAEFNLDAYVQELAALRQEKDGAKTKLLLGRFRNYFKALQFERDLQRIGLKEAFIVGRVDGKIIDFQEALELWNKQH